MVKEFRYTHKKIYDPVHGFIRFDDDEKLLINSIVFQRLHYIRQLGATYLVYPGATHTRFEHSIGVMDLATKMFRMLCKNVRPDLFDLIPRKGSSEYLYWKKVLRIAALCHDLGHLPFSHVAEKQLLPKMGHEYWTLKIIQSSHLKKIWEKITSKSIFRAADSGRNFLNDVIKLALGEKVLKKIDPNTNYHFSSWERVLSEIINGDFFGADRIDCLLRDSRFTGVVYGLFDYLQLIESLRILPDEEDSKNLTLGIDENGLESCEALLLARHFMYKRVYQQSTIKAFNFHLKNFILKILSNLDALKNVDSYVSYNDSDIICELNKASKDPNHFAYEEACKITFRKDKFKAISFYDNIHEQDLINFAKENNIKEDEIAWELREIKKKKKKELSFPVVKNYFTIAKAKEFSFLLSNIPVNEVSWVYIAPKYEMSLLQFLEEKNG